MFIVTNKLALVLGLLGSAFAISTVVLAVFKVFDDADIQALEEKLKEYESVTTLAPIVSTTNIPTTLPPTTVEPEISYRLPTDVIPTLYTLHLHPNLATSLFNGTNAITVQVLSRTNTIVVHSNGLQIQQVSFSTDTRTIPATFELIPKQEFLRITLAEYVEPDTDNVLTIWFGGDMRNRIVGLYSSSYLNEAGERRSMATSKFEPTYARQAFPCFDEPAMKAPFKISLVKPLDSDYIALSNMDVVDSVPDTTTQTETVHFRESVPMSTYLSCFIVSDFKYKELPVLSNGIGKDFTLRAFATPAQLEKVTFSLETGKKITEYYIDYFQEEYPLPKLDMAAIPDFVSGAMEHWGLVTFRETSLLYDPTISSTANKMRVADVVAHEVAHMWFGNLVTMAWWDELWLNEGFASFIQYKGVNAALPEWKLLDQFTISSLHGVLGVDGTLASHPIVQHAENPDQITELFDTITYSKGASIIRMLEDFVGPELFQKAVSNYLKAHKYQNAVTGDLLLELERLIEAANFDYDVEYIMKTWTEQMGYPVVNVTLKGGNTYRLTQSRFLSNPDSVEDVKNSKFNYRWYIPITWKTDVDNTVHRKWFDNLNTEAEIIVGGTHKWLKLNYDQVGYYRVNYEPAMWKALTDALVADVSSFTVLDRAHLLNDVFSLAEATHVPYATALLLTGYLKNEPEYVPWAVASSKLNGLKNSLYYTKTYSQYSKFAKSIIEAPYLATDWTVGTDVLSNQRRNLILSLACSLGVQDCLDKVGVEYRKWLDNPSVRPNPDLRDLVYYYGTFSVGNEETWFKMWDLFVAEPDAQEKIKLMSGLAAVQVPWILQRFVELAWNPDFVRGQDYFSCLQNIAANRIGAPIVWDYVRENWRRLVGRFTLNERYLGSMIPSITSRFSTEQRLQEMKDFFAKYPEAGAGAAARQRALAQVESNIKWLANNEKAIGVWLDANV